MKYEIQGINRKGNDTTVSVDAICEDEARDKAHDMQIVVSSCECIREQQQEAPVICDESPIMKEKHIPYCLLCGGGMVHKKVPGWSEDVRKWGKSVSSISLLFIVIGISVGIWYIISAISFYNNPVSNNEFEEILNHISWKIEVYWAAGWFSVAFWSWWCLGSIGVFMGYTKQVLQCNNCKKTESV